MKLQRLTRKLGATAALAIAATLTGAWCWSPNTGSVVTLQPGCLEVGIDWVYTMYSPSSYTSACAGISTPGCNLCVNESLNITYQYSVWGGNDCTEPLLSMSGFMPYETVTSSYYVPC
jgi:hypothetical protein